MMDWIENLRQRVKLDQFGSLEDDEKQEIFRLIDTYRGKESIIKALERRIERDKRRVGDSLNTEKKEPPIYWAISEFTELHQAGVNYIGLCPFHEEETPSFVLSVQDQRYKCFGCDAEGDLNTFLSSVNK